MTKTVKQIVDEYLNRQYHPEYESITFENAPDGHLESHSEVSNVYRDGVRVTKLKLDNGFHEYQLDRYFKAFYDTPEHSLRVTLRGRVVRLSERIEEKINDRT